MNLLNVLHTFSEMKNVLYIYQGDYTRLQLYIDMFCKVFSNSKIILTKRTYDAYQTLPGNVDSVEILNFQPPIPISEINAFENLLQANKFDAIYIQGESGSFLKEPFFTTNILSSLGTYYKNTKINYCTDQMNVEPLMEVLKSWNEPIYIKQPQFSYECPGVSPRYLLNTLYDTSLLRPKSDFMVEIGRLKGRSTIALAKGIKDSGFGKLISIDPHEGDEVNERLKKYNLHAFVELKRDHSMHYLKNWTTNKANPEIGMVFIDGDHNYMAVYEDIDEWSKILMPGGIIVVDDYVDHFVGVLKAVNELIIWSNRFEEIRCIEGVIIAKKK